MKRITSFFVAICMMFVFCIPAMAEDIITIKVDGAEVDCAQYGQLPVIVEGRTLVPLRSVFEALGATVEWNDAERCAEAVRGDVNISVKVDSTDMIVNGEVKVIDVPATIMSDRTMVPVRAIAEAFGCFVDWDNDSRSVVIVTGAVTQKPEEVIGLLLDAMKNEAFVTAASYFEDPELLWGEFGVDSAEEMSDPTGIVKLVCKWIEIEITGSEIKGDKATVTAKITMPDLEAIDNEKYTDEEVITKRAEAILAEYGYTPEAFETITDEAVKMEILSEVQLEMMKYAVELMDEAAADAPKVTEEGEFFFRLVDGMWKITE